MKNYSRVIDVAFTLEGPWATFHDIPYNELVAGMARRLAALVKEEQGAEPFGLVDECLDKESKAR
jgi:hypothetical protein